MDTEEQCESRTTEFLDIPEEIRGMIYRKLRLEDILNVRLTNVQLNIEADKYYTYSMAIIGDGLSGEHKDFIQNANLERIRFMRISSLGLSRFQLHDEDWDFRDLMIVDEPPPPPSPLKYRGGCQIRTINDTHHTNQTMLVASFYAIPAHEFYKEPNESYKIRYNFSMLREFLMDLKGDVFQASYRRPQ